MFHVQKRMIQRYNLELENWELGRISKLIREGKYIKRIENEDTRDDDIRHFFYILYKNIPLKVLYSLTQSRLITVYPLDIDEYNKIKEQRQMITKYSTDGCSVCKKIGMMLDRIGVSFKEINVSEQPELIEELNIKKVPLLINEKGERLEGMVTVKELKKFCGLEEENEENN